MEEYRQGRIVQTFRTFFVHARQYRPKSAGMLHNLDPPEFVAVGGMPRTVETTSDTVNVSVRPESIIVVDDETRNRWVVELVQRTIKNRGVRRLDQRVCPAGARTLRCLGREVPAGSGRSARKLRTGNRFRHLIVRLRERLSGDGVCSLRIYDSLTGRTLREHCDPGRRFVGEEKLCPWDFRFTPGTPS